MLYIVSRVAPLTAAAAHYSVLSHSSPSKQYYTCGISEQKCTMLCYSTDYVQHTATTVLTVILSCSKIIYVEV